MRGEATLQCGRAPRTRQCDPRNSLGWHWQAWRRIIETSLAGCTAQPKRVSSRHVPWSTGKQDNKDGAGCSSFSEHMFQKGGANAAFSDVRRVTEPAPSKNGNVNPRRVSHCWQVTKETPLPRKTRLDESEEDNSKRDPTHRGGIVRRAPREPFGAGKSRGPQWLLKMSHSQGMICCGLCEAWSISVLRLLTKPCTGQLKRRTESAHATNCMVPTRKNGVAQRHTCASEGPLCRRFVKFFVCYTQN